MAAKIKVIGNDTELDRILNRDFVSPLRTGYVEVGEEKVCLPVYYEQFEEKIRKFQVRDDDIFLLAHPKTGTTWLQETLWLIINDLDYEGAKEKATGRHYQLEFAALFDIKKVTDKDFFEEVVQAKSPRVLKSHLHWSLLPEQIRNGSKQPKIVTVLRSAEDTCVSLYHYSKLAENYTGTFDDFCKLFLGGRVCFGPFWSQILSCWQERHRSNIMFVKYKDMKEDLPSVLKKIAEFLGKTMTAEEVATLAKYVNFESMKNNPAVNAAEVYQTLREKGLIPEEGEFFRSGKVGGYESEMSADLIKRFKIWTEDNLRGTGLIAE